MIEPFPNKPPGMRWSTYWRLTQKARKAEREYCLAAREWLDKHYHSPLQPGKSH
jgi:hypothetical protein